MPAFQPGHLVTKGHAVMRAGFVARTVRDDTGAAEMVSVHELPLPEGLGGGLPPPPPPPPGFLSPMTRYGDMGS